jgi:hypothetical protein
VTCSHPELRFDGIPGVLLGGSCLNPGEAQDYVGFDSGMRMSQAAYPWNAQEGVSFLFWIQDGGVPTNPEEFGHLIDWLEARLRLGRRVHIGCIGGHGRTGMVIAALVAKLLGEKDAIAWTRKHYCTKAVETNAQVTFLGEHFGITRRAASRAHVGKSYGSVGRWSPQGTWGGSYSDAFPTSALPVRETEGWLTRKPVSMPGSIWWSRVEKRKALR